MHPNTILRYCIYIGLFAVPFIFFLVPDSLLFPFISGKAFIFRAIVQVVLGLYLVLILRDKDYSPKSSLILKAISFPDIGYEITSSAPALSTSTRSSILLS